MSRPRISVIIPTIGRPDDLRAMLGTLTKQTIQPDEFVLVNAGKMDLQELVRSCLAGSRITFKYATSRPGTSLQRNIALDMADGDIYFLFDDDVKLEPDYIERSLECFELSYDPPVGVVLGTFSGPARKGGWRRTYRQVFGMTHSVPGAKASLQASGAAQWLINPPDVVSVPVASGGRVAYRAECFDEERFDEFLPGYTISEDVELSYRVSKKWTIVQSPHVKMEHDHSTVNRNAYGDIVARSIYARFYFFRKHQPRDPYHLAAFAWFNVGLVTLYSAAGMRSSGPGAAPVLQGIVRGYRHCVKDLLGKRDW